MCQLFVGGLMSYLRYLHFFAYSGVQHILCCVFLRLLYPMLPVSVDCSFLITLSVFSGLFTFDYPFSILWIVHFWLPLQYSLDCSFLITPSVFSGLFIFDYPFSILWIVHFWLPLKNEQCREYWRGKQKRTIQRILKG
jgi:hypothetical protein